MNSVKYEPIQKRLEIENPPISGNIPNEKKLI